MTDPLFKLLDKVCSQFGDMFVVVLPRPDVNGYIVVTTQAGAYQRIYQSELQPANTMPPIPESIDANDVCAVKIAQLTERLINVENQVYAPRYSQR